MGSVFRRANPRLLDLGRYSKLCSTSGVRDAVEVGFQGADRPSRLPQQSRIWIRVAGAWRAGDVNRWILGVDPPVWLAWTSYEHRQGFGHPQWGLFVYDAEVIRQRTDDRPPDDMAPDGGSDAGPG